MIKHSYDIGLIILVIIITYLQFIRDVANKSLPLNICIKNFMYILDCNCLL